MTDGTFGLEREGGPYHGGGLWGGRIPRTGNIYRGFIGVWGFSFPKVRVPLRGVIAERERERERDIYIYTYAYIYICIGVT